MVYVGIGPEEGNIVDEDEAFDYAMQRCGVVFVNKQASDYAPFAEEFRNPVVEWYFSGNWRVVGD